MNNSFAFKLKRWVCLWVTTKPSLLKRGGKELGKQQRLLNFPGSLQILPQLSGVLLEVGGGNGGVHQAAELRTIQSSHPGARESCSACAPARRPRPPGPGAPRGPLGRAAHSQAARPRPGARGPTYLSARSLSPRSASAIPSRLRATSRPMAREPAQPRSRGSGSTVGGARLPAPAALRPVSALRPAFGLCHHQPPQTLSRNAV